MASSALLAQIQAGKALKKTVTNDRSAPALAGSNKNTPSAGAFGGAPAIPVVKSASTGATGGGGGGPCERVDAGRVRERVRRVAVPWGACAPRGARAGAKGLYGARARAGDEAEREARGVGEEEGDGRVNDWGGSWEYDVSTDIYVTVYRDLKGGLLLSMLR